MKRARSLLGAALVALALTPLPAYADIALPNYDEETQTWSYGDSGSSSGYVSISPEDGATEGEDVASTSEDEMTEGEDVAPSSDEGAKEDERQRDQSGCSSASVATYAEHEATDNVGLVAVVGGLSLAGTAGVVYLSDDKRP